MTCHPTRRYVLRTALAGTAAGYLAGPALASEAPQPDEETQALLQVLLAPDRKALFRQTVEEARATLVKDAETLAVPPVAIGNVQTTTVYRREGDIPIRVYTPRGVAEDAVLPIVIFVHGGAFVAGSIETHDDMARRIAEASTTRVVSVGYRRAPEHPFPNGIDDCTAVVEWAAQNGAQINGDPDRIALIGDGAGGTLALATALRLQRMGGARVRTQVLCYPVLDLTDDATYPSRRRFGTGLYGLNAADIVWMREQYVPENVDADEALVSPLRARSLEGLPNTLVITAGFDPLRDEGGFLVRRLREEGVIASERHFATTIHGFMFYPQILSAARGAIDAVGLHLKATLT